jgi:hypothetical protein
MPLVLGLVVIALAVGGYFAYTTWFSGTGGGGVPMTPAAYKAKVLEYAEIMKTSGTSGPSTDAMSQLTSEDPAARADALKVWNDTIKQTRDAMNGMKALVPPAEYRSIHDRLVKGLAAADKLLVLFDGLIQKLGNGTLTSANLLDSPEYTAIMAISTDKTLEADSTGYTEALAELQAK